MHRKNTKERIGSGLLLGIVLMMAGICVLSGVSLAAEQDIPGGQELYSMSELPVEKSGQVIITDMGMQRAEKVSFIDIYYENPLNSYEELKVPSQYIYQGGYYFIVDTYHDQVLYTKNPAEPIKNWRVMAGGLHYPHAIAGDGEVWLVADTDNDCVLIFERINGRFENTQRLTQVGVRPHDIRYDEATDSFWVWSSMTGEMYILKNDAVSGRVCIQEIRKLCELEDYYIRSFTIMGDVVLFPSGTNGYMLTVDKDTFEVLQRYPVPDEIAGMACVRLIGDDFYISVACDLYGGQESAALIRTDDLGRLRDGGYENISELYGLCGIPYYIEQVKDCYYMTIHGTPTSVLKFRAAHGVMGAPEAVYSSG
ncbi:MAG: hypothetical protein NC254_09410 [bacterium]|nr:hypothetical protein [bacterium]